MKDIKLIFRDNMNEYLNKIKEAYPKAKFYSHSRLGNYHQCPRQYFFTYVNKKSQKVGVYSTLGTACHDTLEELYEGKVDKLNKAHFDDIFNKCELFGINFPVSKYDIAGGYKKDIYNFYEIYKKRDGQNKKFISELGFILQVDTEHYIIGYIDLLILNEDGSADIVDFKTSSTFDTKHTIEAGRQLVLYKMAIEQLYGIKVNTVSWEMLKYVDVQVDNNKLKVGLKGREWVSKCEPQIRKLMKSEGIDEGLIDLYLSQAVNSNSIKNLPQNIQDKIKVNVQIRYYDVTEDTKKEYIDYINDSIKTIESIDTENIDLWEVKVDKFFCFNLCGFYPKHCNCQ
jgi:hypothetical protein